MTTMRANFRVAKVEKFETSERITFAAVAKSTGYPADGTDEDNSFDKWTPSAELTMTITNPALHGQFEADEKRFKEAMEKKKAEKTKEKQE